MARPLWGFVLAGFCAYDASCATAPIVGGYTKASVMAKDVRAAARFAIETRSSAIQQPEDQQRASLKLIRVVAAETQVVAGTNYRLTLSVTEAGARKTAIATVWWQPWRSPSPYELTSWQWK